eukprot:6203513-Pleurochrysis_carterae.AAC.5
MSSPSYTIISRSSCARQLCPTLVCDSHVSESLACQAGSERRSEAGSRPPAEHRPSQATH